MVTVNSARGASSRSTVYVMALGGAAFLAASVIGGVLLSGRDVAAPSATAAVDSQNAAEIKVALSEIKRDIVSVGSRLSSLEDQGQTWSARLASLEERTALGSAQQVAGQAAPGRVASVHAGEEAARRPEARGREITTGAILQKAAAPAEAEPKPAETPRIALTPQAVESQAPAAPAKAPKKYAIQLTQAASVDQLRLSWNLLSERHPSMARLQSRYRQSQARPGAPYQLIAGPFETAAEASRACKEVAAQGLACAATTFNGSAL